MFSLLTTVCFLALAKTADNQAVYQTVDTESLSVLVSPSRDPRRFLPPPDRETLQNPARSTINRLRNNGNVNLNLPPPPVTITESQPSQQLFITRIDTYSPNYRPLIKTSDGARDANGQYHQNNKDTNDNINLEESVPIIIDGGPKNQGQRTQYGTGEDKRPDITNKNYDNANNPSNNKFDFERQPQSSVTIIEESQSNKKQPFPQRKGGQHTRPNVQNVNKTHIQNKDRNTDTDKVDFENDKPTQASTMKPSVTRKPSDLALVNGTDNVNVTFDQRASFNGDKCPTGYIRVNGSSQCIPTD